MKRLVYGGIVAIALTAGGFSNEAFARTHAAPAAKSPAPAASTSSQIASAFSIDFAAVAAFQQEYSSASRSEKRAIKAEATAEFSNFFQANFHVKASTARRTANAFVRLLIGL